LDRITAELGIFAGAFGKLGREQRPLPALGQRLQPFAAQAIGKRPSFATRQEALHPVGIGVVEPQLELPVFDVRFERMALEPGRDPVQPYGVIGMECFARDDKIGVGRLGARARRRVANPAAIASAAAPSHERE
jgi:hypothetical protein